MFFILVLIEMYRQTFLN